MSVVEPDILLAMLAANPPPHGSLLEARGHRHLERS